jgi:flavin reductase (DIM6/NTAB) family NADH-FMN oxidoreductase RutF
MNFDIKQENPRVIYNLLIGLVAPRPIALVTSLSSEGRLNAAPFSAYNYLGIDPPIIALGVGNRPDGSPKNTARNIRATGEFVVNVVTAEIAEKMNICATEYPSEIDETKEAGFTARPSMIVKVPQLEECPASLECREHMTMEIGRSRVILGLVVAIRVNPEFLDPTGPYIKAEQMHAIGRMNGLGNYVKTEGAFFNMPRLKPPQSL